MLKPTSTYKMSSAIKTSLAMCRFTNAHAYGRWKRIMIEAELQSRVVVKSTKSDRDSRRPGSTANYVTNDTGTASTQM